MCVSSRHRGKGRESTSCGSASRGLPQGTIWPYSAGAAVGAQSPRQFYEELPRSPAEKIFLSSTPPSVKGPRSVQLNTAVVLGQARKASRACLNTLQCTAMSSLVHSVWNSCPRSALELDQSRSCLCMVSLQSDRNTWFVYTLLPKPSLIGSVVVVVTSLTLAQWRAGVQA